MRFFALILTGLFCVFAEAQFLDIGSVQGVTQNPSSGSLNVQATMDTVILHGISDFAGSDPANSQIDTVNGSHFNVYVMEEQSVDNELVHVAEKIDFIAGDKPLYRPEFPNKMVVKFGSLTVEQTSSSQWHTVNFGDVSDPDFNNPVVIARLQTKNNPEPSHIRVRNVTPYSFEFKIEEWQYQDGISPAEKVGWAVFEKGVYTLGDGSLTLEVRDILTHQTSGWTQRVLNTAVKTDVAKRVMLTQSQTFNGSAPIVTRSQILNDNKWMVRLQEEQSQVPTGHIAETVGIVIIKDSDTSTHIRRSENEYRVAVVQVNEPGENFRNLHVCYKRDTRTIYGPADVAQYKAGIREDCENSDLVYSFDEHSSENLYDLYYGQQAFTELTNRTTVAARKKRADDFKVYSFRHLENYIQHLLDEANIQTTSLGEDPTFSFHFLPVIEKQDTIALGNSKPEIVDFFADAVSEKQLDLSSYDYVIYIQNQLRSCGFGRPHNDPECVQAYGFNRGFADYHSNAVHSVYVNFNAGSDMGNDAFNVVAHELGHAFFSLIDTYEGFGGQYPKGAPNWDTSTWPSTKACLMARKFPNYLIDEGTFQGWDPQHEVDLIPPGGSIFMTTDPYSYVLCEVSKERIYSVQNPLGFNPLLPIILLENETIDDFRNGSLPSIDIREGDPPIEIRIVQAYEDISNVPWDLYPDFIFSGSTGAGPEDINFLHPNQSGQISESNRYQFTLPEGMTEWISPLGLSANVDSSAESSENFLLRTKTTLSEQSGTHSRIIRIIDNN